MKARFDSGDGLLTASIVEVCGQILFGVVARNAGEPSVRRR
jgi:hypothetical protein